MDFRRFVFLVTLVLMVQQGVSIDLSEEWTKYKTVYNKTYVDDGEETLRRSIWEDNFRRIDEHNNAANKGLHRYWLKMNHFGDMKTDEINSVMNRLKAELSNKAPGQNTKYITTKDQPVKADFDKSNQGYYADVLNVTNIPDRIDWRKKGYVTSVKYQGHCGSCYAFSATGALEGQHFRKTGKLVSLSEQNIVDCTFFNKYRDHGCYGGLMDHAFRYIIDVGGVDTESSYPYEAKLSLKVGRCRFRHDNVGATAKSYKDILPRGDEIKLKEAVGRFGPVSVGIDAHGFGFHFYSHGIYDSWFCSHARLNHGMLVVGYDSDCDSVVCTHRDYWIVKNSWGTWWGLEGYVKMARNKGNRCGIASLASVPIV